MGYNPFIVLLHRLNKETVQIRKGIIVRGYLVQNRIDGYDRLVIKRQRLWHDHPMSSGDQHCLDKKLGVMLSRPRLGKIKPVTVCLKGHDEVLPQLPQVRVLRRHQYSNKRIYGSSDVTSIQTDKMHCEGLLQLSR